MIDERKLVELGKRVYNNKMTEKIDEKGNLIYSDSEDIKALCSKVFGDGSLSPDPSLLHSFNNIIVKTADAVAQPQIAQMMNILANYQKANPGDLVMYDIPQVDNLPKILYSAVGATADLVRLTKDTKVQPAIARTFTFAAYYNPLDFVKDSVKAFNDAVNSVAQAKLKLYFELIMNCVDKAVSTNLIPKNNNLLGNDIKLNDFRKLESRFIRLGGRPVLVADSLLIDKIAGQFAIDATEQPLLTDDLKAMLREDLVLNKVSKSIAFNITNPYTDAENTKTQFPVNEGFMFAGVSGKKPIYITEFGGTRQIKATEDDSKRIKLQLDFEADVTLLNGRFMGKIKDDSLKLD